MHYIRSENQVGTLCAAGAALNLATRTLNDLFKVQSRRRMLLPTHPQTMCVAGVHYMVLKAPFARS